MPYYLANHKTSLEIVEEILGPLAAVNLPPPDSGEHDQDPWIILDFLLRPQPQSSLWCWAAVTAAVLRYYEPSSQICQCEVVNTILNKKNCCKHISKPSCEKKDSRIPGGCNKDHSLKEALGCFKHLDHAVTCRPPLDDIRREIYPNKRVIGFREKLEAHFVVVDGFRRDRDIVHLRDPYNDLRVEAQYDLWCVTYAYFTR